MTIERDYTVISGERIGAVNRAVRIISAVALLYVWYALGQEISHDKDGDGYLDSEPSSADGLLWWYSMCALIGATYLGSTGLAGRIPSIAKA